MLQDDPPRINLSDLEIMINGCPALKRAGVYGATYLEDSDAWLCVYTGRPIRYSVDRFGGIKTNGETIHIGILLQVQAIVAHLLTDEAVHLIVALAKEEMDMLTDLASAGTGGAGEYILNGQISHREVAKGILAKARSIEKPFDI